MTALSVNPPYPIFTETDGQPLENGYIWIGTANLDPQTNPITVYWDVDLTITASQPIRTIGGYPARAGTPARIYANSDYSIRVMNKNGSTVYSAPESTDPLLRIVNEFPSVTDYGADPTGTTNSNAAFSATESSSITTFYLPEGTYILTDRDILNKTYWGPGSIEFSDGFVQGGLLFYDTQPRNEANRTIIANADLVLAPQGDVQLSGRRLIDVGLPVADGDAATVGWAKDNLALFQSGTFSPVMQGTTTDGTATYTTQYGRWSRMGDVVFLRIKLVYTGHTGTGAMRIPFTTFTQAGGISTSAGNLLLASAWNTGTVGSIYVYMTNGYLYPAKDYADGSGDSLLSVQANDTVDLNIWFHI